MSQTGRSVVMNEENRQGRNHGDPDEQAESYPHCHLAPAATAQTTGEVTEALDGPAGLKGSYSGSVTMAAYRRHGLRSLPHCAGCVGQDGRVRLLRQASRGRWTAIDALQGK